MGAADFSHGWSDAKRSVGIAEPVVDETQTLVRPKGAKEALANATQASRVYHTPILD